MAAPNALITLDEAKTHLGIALTDESADDRILDLIDAASNQIERYCKTYFIQRTVTDEPHDGSSKYMYLSFYPIVSVTSIVDAGGSTVPSTDYYVDKPLGILRHWGRFPRASSTSGFQTKWLVTYVAGWYAGIELVDADLKMACKRIVAMNYENPTGGVNSVSVGSLSVSYSNPSVDGISGGMAADVAGLLSTYKRNVTP